MGLWTSWRLARLLLVHSSFKQHQASVQKLMMKQGQTQVPIHPTAKST